MANRKILNHCLRYGMALSLLIAVIVSPILSFRAIASARSNYLRRNFGVPKADNHRPATPVTSRILLVKALHSEAEKDLNCWTSPVYYSAERPGHSRAQVDSDRHISRSARAIPPLRC